MKLDLNLGYDLNFYLELENETNFFYINLTADEENYADLFTKFCASSLCPTSVSISIKRAQNRTENYQKGFKEPTSEEVIESQPIDNTIDNDTQDLLKTTTNLRDTIDIFEKLEKDGLDIGKNYRWDKRILAASDVSYPTSYSVRDVYCYVSYAW